jgi:hypothetical protein
VLAPALALKGPIDVVNGENDVPFCRDDCLTNKDRSQKVRKTLFPAAGAGSDSYILKGAGNALNLASNAEGAYNQIYAFLKLNGLY